MLATVDGSALALVLLILLFRLRPLFSCIFSFFSCFEGGVSQLRAVHTEPPGFLLSFPFWRPGLFFHVALSGFLFYFVSRSSRATTPECFGLCKPLSPILLWYCAVLFPDFGPPSFWWKTVSKLRGGAPAGPNPPPLQVVTVY